VIGDLCHRLGGLVALTEQLTSAKQQANFEGAELSIRFDPTVRQATFKVDLACGASVRVGEGSRMVG